MTIKTFQKRVNTTTNGGVMDNKFEQKNEKRYLRENNIREDGNV